MRGFPAPAAQSDRRAVGEQGLKAILVYIDADLLDGQGLNDGKEIHSATGKAAALVDEHLHHGVCIHI